MAGDWIIYKKDAMLRRLNPDSADADKEGYVTIISNFKISLQPAGPEYQMFYEGGAGKVYTGLTTQSGIRISDMVVLSGTATFSGIKTFVRGIEEWSGPMGTYYRLVLAEPNE